MFRIYLPALSFCAIAVCFPVETQACCHYYPSPYLSPNNERELSRDRFGELQIIGHHFYPEWCDHPIVHNTIKTDSAHRLDFYAACARFDIVDSKAAFDDYWMFYHASKDTGFGLKDHALLIDSVPTGLQEFYLYSWGLSAYKTNPKPDLSEPWKKLMSLPKSQRHYRTMWVAFADILAQQKFDDIDVALNCFQLLRREGFADTLGLESSVLRQLVRRGDRAAALRYLPLFLAAQQTDTEYVDKVRDDFRYLRDEVRISDESDMFNRLKVDDAGCNVLLVCAPDDMIKAYENGFRWQYSCLFAADRLAWYSLNAGDLERTRKYLEYYGTKSMLYYYVKARYSRLMGDNSTAVSCLREWLALYQFENQRMEGFTADLGEHWTGPEVIHVIYGQLGAGIVWQERFSEAIYVFLKANSWDDAALVAEDMMSTDALIEFVKNNPNTAYKKELLHLLARRLMREYRVREAGEYFPEEERKYYDDYVECSVAANDSSRSGNDRAVSFYKLAMIASHSGMELFGTELYPDGYIHEGSFEMAPPSLRRYNRETERFHYRGRAADFALRGAMLAEDNYLRTGLLLLGGRILRDRNAKSAEVFYRMLCDMPSEFSNVFRDYAVFSGSPRLGGHAELHEVSVKGITDYVKSMIRESKSREDSPKKVSNDT